MLRGRHSEGGSAYYWLDRVIAQHGLSCLTQGTCLLPVGLHGTAVLHYFSKGKYHEEIIQVNISFWFALTSSSISTLHALKASILADLADTQAMVDCFSPLTWLEAIGTLFLSDC